MSDPSSGPGNSLSKRARAWSASPASGRLHHTIGVAREHAAVLILTIASIISAVAAVIGLQEWVPIIATITAVISGLSLLRSALLVPARTRIAEDATARVATTIGEPVKQWGTCVQIAPGQWATVTHVVHNERGPIAARVLMDGQWHDVQSMFNLYERGLVFLTTGVAGPVTAKLARALPSPGTKIEIVGWMGPIYQQPSRLTLEYTVTAPVREDLILLNGPPTPRGFGGAAAIELSTGRVVGVLMGYSHGKEDAYGGPETLGEALVLPLTRLPAEFRSATQLHKCG